MDKVAIIGAGRMGGILSKKLAPYYDLILVIRSLRKGGLLAMELGGIATSEYSILAKANYIITALPAGVIPNVLDKISQFLRKDQILINISTNTERHVFKTLEGKCHIASAKIIGESNQIDLGELPLILVDGDDEKVKNEVASVFGHIGIVCFGDEKLVSKINKIASEQGIRAALEKKQQLEELNVPEEYISFAIRNVAAGTMNAFALGDESDFVKEIVEKIKSEKKN